MNINIKTIPHKDQRYETIGDWWYGENGLEIRISKFGDYNRYEWDIYEWLIAQHEINEALMCLRDGIEEKSVSDYDIAFEQMRLEFPNLIGNQEPGDMIAAPYHKQHIAATEIEKLTAKKFGIDWDEYTKTVEEL